MDPVSIVVMAIALGATAGLKSTAEQAVKDLYAGLKKQISTKYASAKTGVALIEKDPKSKTFQTATQELLEKTEASKDQELLDKAIQLVEAVQKAEPETVAAFGVSLKDIKDASLEISQIESSGDGVQVEKARIQGPIKIKGVRAGKE